MTPLVLIATAVIVTYLLISRRKNPPTVEQNRHGHRCYVEGLSQAETRVVETLSKGLDYKKYFIFNNLILPNGSGSSQIDHLVVSRNGIFVIESKDYHGWIFGSEKNKEWTQTLPGGYKYPFQNPLRQNFGHIATLQSLMPFIPQHLFYSVVVFANKCEFKTARPPNVYFLSEVVDAIKAVTAENVSEQDLLLVIGKLSMLCQATDITAVQHIANVKSLLARKELVN